jgi:hypothetical protein
MGKYRIHASYVVTLFLDIDAENIDDACWNIDEVSLLYGEIK